MRVLCRTRTAIARTLARRGPSPEVCTADAAQRRAPRAGRPAERPDAKQLVARAVEHDAHDRERSSARRRRRSHADSMSTASAPAARSCSRRSPVAILRDARRSRPLRTFRPRPASAPTRCARRRSRPRTGSCPSSAAAQHLVGDDHFARAPTRASRPPQKPSTSRRRPRLAPRSALGRRAPRLGRAHAGLAHARAAGRRADQRLPRSRSGAATISSSRRRARRVATPQLRAPSRRAASSPRASRPRGR